MDTYVAEISVLVIICLIPIFALSADEIEPKSLDEAGIKIIGTLFGPTAGPYGMPENQKPSPVIYEGEQVHFLFTLQHAGFAEVSILDKDGDFKKQITAKLRKDGKNIECPFDADGKLSRTDTRGRKAEGTHPLSQGDLIQSAWKLTSHLESGNYEITLGFTAYGDYKNNEKWKKELKPIKFTVKTAENDMDKLNADCRKAYWLLNDGKPDEAISELKKLLETYPDSYFAYEYLGYCYEKLKDSDKSVEMLEKAAEIIENDKDNNIKFSGLEKSAAKAYLDDMIAKAKNTK